MNPKRSINKKTTFNKNMVGGKRKKSSKKKGSKKKGSKKKSSKKKDPKKQVVKRVVSRPVFYNTYDPVYDYLSASRLGSSFNNLTNISSAPTGNRDYLTQNYQDALTSTRNQSILSTIENISNRTMNDDPTMSGMPIYSSGFGADYSYDPSVEAGYQAMGINTRGQRLDAELEAQTRARQRADQATTHSVELGAAVYGPAYLQPNFDAHNMHANPSLDNMFHQEEIMMNGGGFDF